MQGMKLAVGILALLLSTTAFADPEARQTEVVFAGDYGFRPSADGKTTVYDQGSAQVRQVNAVVDPALR